MKKDLLFYDVGPRVVPANRESVIEIRPRFDHCRFQPDRFYEVTHVMMEDTRHKNNAPVAEVFSLKAEDGVLRLRCFFEGEQEHVFLGFKTASETPPGGHGELRVHVYSVNKDLLGRRPFKGDPHLHSNQSDGLESPAYVAGASRRIGLDFMAVTDHHRYAPSLEAIRAFAGISHDLRIYPGEEVHPPKSGVHIINFGGSFSVNDLFKDDGFSREVEERQKREPPVPPGVDARDAASCLVCFDKIREAGGLGVFCHPYWMFHSHYSLSEALVEYMFEKQPFDAYELLGGFSLAEAESNILQLARYHDERARGRTVPIVGASDSHGCERGDLFGWYYTIVFSPSLDLTDLIGSIKQGYSVAVEALPGELVRAHGPFRFVKYALFLLREVLPLHDELCAEEGRLMLALLSGQPAAAADLARLSGRCARLYRRLWAE